VPGCQFFTQRTTSPSYHIVPISLHPHDAVHQVRVPLGHLLRRPLRPRRSQPGHRARPVHRRAGQRGARHAAEEHSQADRLHQFVLIAHARTGRR
jgi:hypothetical protein